MNSLSNQGELVATLQNQLSNSHKLDNSICWDFIEENKTLHELFEQQALKNPNDIALIYENQRLSYKELNEMSNCLARHIRKNYEEKTGAPMTADTLIPLCLERSIEMIVGILGILKAGGAYVPIEPAYPKSRIHYILEDIKAVLILTQKHVNARIELPQEKVLYIEPTESLYKEEDNNNLPTHSKETDLAYIIYTSGTTGTPKGVMIEHRGVVNYLQSQRHFLKNPNKKRFYLLHSYAFDTSVSCIFGAICFSNTLVVTNNANRLSNKTFNLHDIHIAYIPPALLASLDSSDLSSLNILIVSGESSNAEILKKFSGLQIINEYGPTEATVGTTYYEMTHDFCVSNIGKLIANKKAYVLDTNNVPVPIGEIGELHIGGTGLARGYLNLPDLTADRFIPNPFATKTDIKKGNIRMYKTGDLVKYLPDGNLQFIGRNDDQVKIRGYRIELGEIESALLQIKGIKQSCALVKNKATALGDNKYIVVYYVLDNDAETLTQAEILDALSQSLPDYMIPTATVEMKSLPLTVNGKLDKKSLPDPTFDMLKEHNAPTSELEKKLCIVWQEILGLENVGVTDNFFQIGGNSVLSIQLKQKLNQLEEFQHLTVADLFKYNTIQKLINSFCYDHSTIYHIQNGNNNSKTNEIAIISTSGVFSGANNVHALWQLISTQQEGIQFYNKENCQQLGVSNSIAEHPDFVPAAGQVNGIELFDPLFWGISPNEAKQIDPQIRKFVEHCWTVLEAAGYAHDRKKHHIGIFAGSGLNKYFHEYVLQGDAPEQMNLWEAAHLNSKDALATKAAFLLDLSGPANSINTACSTGLVAIAEACKNLQLGACNMALAGGVSLSMPDQIGYIYEEGMILSKDGHCRTFDSKASGTIMTSGIGVVLLKRLDDAIKDNDVILGVIKGYATNNDGARKVGYTAPSVTGQSECIINAQKMAGITSDQIDYIECHGTATHLGDLIEIQALKEAFTYNSNSSNKTNQHSEHKTILGSIKANIGHTDSAAGAIGLIKVCAMLQNNLLPGQIHFDELSAELPLDQTNFEIIKKNRAWPANPHKQRLAGVSSFGVGGTNAHVIIGDYIAGEEKNAPTATNTNSSLPYIIPISANSRQSLEYYRHALLSYLITNKHDSIQNIAYTLQERRAAFDYRSAYSVTTIDQLIDQLRTDHFYIQANTATTNKTVFLFPGQGTQYTNMGKSLYDSDPIFKNIIDQCIVLVNRHIDIDFFEILYPKQKLPLPLYDINQTQWAQISLFIIEFSLAKYLGNFNIKADAYLGHSIGEYVAATLSGVFTLEDAIKIVICRGKLMQSMPSGSMLAVNATEEIIKEFVAVHHCEIAVVNSLEDIVISGSDNDIVKLKATLDEQIIPSVVLPTSHAYHSTMMEQAASEFENAFKNVSLNKPQKDFISNVTGEIANEEVTQVKYWCDQLRNTVQFAKGIATLSRQYHHINFIELGPGKGLSSFVNKYKNANSYKTLQTIPLLPSAKEAKNEAHQNIIKREYIKARLWMAGMIEKPNPLHLFKQAKLQINLPTYHFNYQSYWIKKNNNIIKPADQHFLMQKFKEEVDQLPVLTKNSVVELLQKLLSPTTEKTAISDNDKKVAIVEKNYTKTEYQLAQIIGSMLGVEEISIHDDFFKLGGNSILAIRVSHQISDTFQCEVKVADIFKYKTISELSIHGLNQLQITIPRSNTSEGVLSFAQDRLWFIELYEQGTNAYHLPLLYELDPSTNIPGIQHALKKIVARHEILRSTIEQKHNAAHSVQTVHQKPVLIEEQLVTDTDNYQSILQEDINRPFNLTGDYPIRIKLYKFFSNIKNGNHPPSKTILLVNIHHIAGDGWSLYTFEKELFAYYQAYINNVTDFALPTLPIQYKDYAVWQRAYLTGKNLDNQISYWKNKLSGYVPLELPTDYPRPGQIDYRGENEVIRIEKTVSQRIRKLAQFHGVSLHSALLSSFYILLNKYTGQSDLVIGSPIANRHHNQTENLIGFFVNTQVNRAVLNELQSYKELIHQVHEEQIVSQLYQDLPFEKLVSELEVNRDSSRHPVFQILFSVQDFGNHNKMNEWQKKCLKPLNIEEIYKIAQFDLSVFVDDTDEELSVRLNYATSLFHRDTIARMGYHYNHLLQQLVLFPDKPYSTISLLDEKIYKKIIYEWNDTERAYQKDKTIHELFEEQARKTPNNIALVYEGQQLTYADLNNKSNQLARHIRAKYEQKTKQPLQPDTLIVLCLERSLEMMIGILAVLKAGGAYVPIEPHYPKERIEHILNDTKTELILTQKQIIENDIELPQEKILYIELTENIYEEEATENLLLYNQPTDLAYVIYTSGTTGKPKGVMLEHRGIVNRIEWMQTMYPLDETDVVLQKTPYVFDVSVWEILWANWYGAKIVLAKPEGHKDSEYLHRLIEEQSVTTLHFVPSMLEAYNHFLTEYQLKLPLTIKQMFSSGEALHKNVIQQTYHHSVLNPLFKLHNLYGPTEASVDVTFFETNPDKNVCIGKPIQNTQVYILDSQKNPVPVGVIGELYLGGIGLSRGYLNLPDLTAERFVSNPFVTTADIEKGYTRLYKTGDLVKRLYDGNIEYIGRNDDQIKIRGYRIELGEIESALLQIAGIQQCCALVKERKTASGEIKYIVGYYVSDNKELSTTIILSRLAKLLPEYMVPSALIAMDSLPTTINGKLDKKSLPDPTFKLTEEHIAPTTEIEKKLCAIWQEVLELENISVTDDFFQIGGNSILAIRLVSLINLKLNAQIAVKDIFQYKTISHLSSLVEKTIGYFKYEKFLIQNEAVDADNAFELTNVQQAYLYGRLEAFEMGNVSTHSYFELLFNTFDHNKFEAALNILIQRHGTLRTIFKNEAQYILSKVPYYHIKNNNNVNSIQLEGIRTRLSHKIYQVDQWPLFDYEVSKNATHTTLHISMDALIMDGSSSRIFFDELAQLYNAPDAHQVELPELKINFRDYMMKYSEIKTSDLYSKAKQYWVQKLDAYNFDASLPMAADPRTIAQPQFTRLTKTIPLSKWSLIETKATHYQISPTSVVLYAYGLVLTKWSGQPKFCINLTLFNRLPLHEQINNILGDFTVLELFNFQRETQKSLRTTIQEIHNELWNDIDHNLFDGIDFQRFIRKELNIAQNQSLSPVVLTSILGNKSFDIGLREFQGYGYSITQTSQVYLDNKAYNTSEGFVAEWDYVKQLFDPAVIQQMHEDYCYLIELLAEMNWEEALPTIGLAKQDQTIINNANNYHQPEVTQTLVEICLPPAISHPDKIAVIDKKGSYTYKEVNIYNFRIASYLYDHGLSKPNYLIGILSEKGYQQVIATIGIMRSGAAYLPLHVDWPTGRIDEVLKQGMVTAVLISQSAFHKYIKNSVIEFVYKWLIIEEIIHYRSKTTEEQLPKGNINNIAYVIFTSGSTGKPKGVTISHKGAINTIVAINNKFNINKNDNVLALSELSFDLSVYDIFGLLAAGGTIVFPDQEKTKEPNHWYQLIKKHGITIWNTVPQLMQLLVDYVIDMHQMLPTLKAVLMSGDWIPVKLPLQIKELNEAATIMSLGGATEGSIWSIWHEIEEVDSTWTAIPYGQAMPNQKMYVLNQWGEHCPVGVIGEIHIGGEGVALGYWNDLEKSNASFIQHNNLGWIYKTGDLGKWNKAGYMEFEGRKDNQVKLNGYRVELDEISSVLTRIEGIDKALVTIQHNQLVAYLVVKNDPVPFEKCKTYLAKYLPDYMLPNHYITLDSIPLTSNGKADYRQLPKAIVTPDEYVAPETNLEKQLCNSWQEVLGQEKIGVTSDFFRMGGNSILAIQVAHRMSSILKNDIKVSDVFRLKSISNILTAHDQCIELVKPYNDYYNTSLDDMVFIPPGRAGAEMYQPLAEALATKYNCIGIDNYNIHSTEKINSLKQLANYYLSEYEKIYILKNNIYLLGWSLGGKIALEMATILEERGYTNIHIILLDTFLTDEKMLALIDPKEEADFIEEEKIKMLEKYEAAYVEKVVAAMHVETEIEKAPISSLLKHAQVLLFKAMQRDTHNSTKNAQLLSEYCAALVTNNIDVIAENLQVVPLNCHHFNIVDTVISTKGLMSKFISL